MRLKTVFVKYSTFQGIYIYICICIYLFSNNSYTICYSIHNIFMQFVFVISLVQLINKHMKLID